MVRVVPWKGRDGINIRAAVRATSHLGWWVLKERAEASGRGWPARARSAELCRSHRAGPGNAPLLLAPNSLLSSCERLPRFCSSLSHPGSPQSFRSRSGLALGVETFLYLWSALPLVVPLAVLYSFLDGLAGYCVKYLQGGHRMDLFGGVVLSGPVLP